jgi:sugar/nucleoside kinase (ribokinase family)
MSTGVHSPDIVGFGAGALDFYLPVGEIGEGHIPGAKAGWTEQDQLKLESLVGTDTERHVGGNVVNALAWLACKTKERGNVALASVIGVGDPATLAIRDHLPRVGIHSLVKEDPSYLPSASLVERAAPGSDRMVRGRPRTRMDGYMDEGYITDVSANAKLVVVASLKSAELADQVFKHTPNDAFISFNPGSTEFVHYPDMLIASMVRRNPQLLSLNDDELRQLFSAPRGSSVESLAESATEFSEAVLCTLGAKGIMLTRRLHLGRIEQTKLSIKPMPANLVKDTLGAGDRANAVTTYGLFMGHAPHLILDQAVESTASVIQKTGAHGDLY